MSPERPVVSLGTHSWGSCFPAGSMWEEQRHRPFASHCHVLLPQPGHPRRDSGYRAPVLDKVYSALVLAGPVSSPAGPVTNMSHLLLHAQACRLQATVAKVHAGLSMGATGRAWATLREGWGPGQRVQRWHQCSALQSRSREAEAWLCMPQGAGRALVWVVREALTPWGSSNLWPSRCPAGAR